MTMNARRTRSSCVLPTILLLAGILAGCKGSNSAQPPQPSASPDLHGATGGYDPATSHPWFRGMLNPPRVNLALPADFTCVSYSPKGDWNMHDGVIWSDPATARAFERRRQKDLSRIDKPLIYARLSAEVAHKPGTDTFTNEQIDQQMRAIGFRDVNKQKLRWGPYPVLAVTGTRPDGTPFYAAWVGTNTPEGWTIMLDYRVPRGAGHPTAAESDIWNRLMRETTASP
jgi:hypothetical protein